jgi:hypothetical protein
MPCITTRSRPLVLRGTLTTFRRRCGKATCRCATGDPHESPALTFTENGRTKTITLTAAQVRQVEAALARYEAARAELEAQAQAGLARFRGQLGDRQGGGRRRGGADPTGRGR